MTHGEVQDLMLAFNKALIERLIGAEMNLHLGYKPVSPSRPSKRMNATALAPRQFTPSVGRCESICRAIGRVVSHPS